MGKSYLKKTPAEVDLIENLSPVDVAWCDHFALGHTKSDNITKW